MAWVKERERADKSIYYCVFFREDGKQRSLSFGDSTEAHQFAELVDQIGPGKAREVMNIVTTTRTGLTVSQWCLQHIEHLSAVEKGTAKRYRAYVRNDIAGPLGDLLLDDLKAAHVAGWIAELTADGASGKTVANKHGFLAGALNGAVRAGHIKTNPCEGTKLPRWDREEMVFLERDEFALFIAEVPDYWRPLVEFLVSSGCRWSEATALKPAAINVTKGTVRITKAWKTGAGGYTLGVPKTKMSVRTINVPTRVLANLDLSGEWVFTNSGRGKGKFADGAVRDDDRPVRAHSFHPNVWVPALTRARAKGLEKSPRIHDLRHTCASWLIQSGRPLPDVQGHMGHESIVTTVKNYGHLDRTSGQDNAAAIDAMLP